MQESGDHGMVTRMSGHAGLLECSSMMPAVYAACVSARCPSTFELFQSCHGRDECARGPEDTPPNWRKPSRNQHLRERIDAETYRCPDDRPVDPDVLQVGPDRTL